MSPQRIAVIAVGVALVAAGVFAGYATFAPGERKFEATDITGAPWGRGFELTDHNGKPRTLADFRGKLVLLFFGFTNCPDVCPTTMATLGETLRRLGPEAKDVQGLFVTVDPKRDTPEVLAKYVPAFHPGFLGLYGDEAATERAAKEFKIYFEAEAPNHHGGYSVTHSSQVYVFDRAGRLRLYIKAHAVPVDAIARDLRALLKEPAG